MNQNKLVKLFDVFRHKGKIPNFMLLGPHGTGKKTAVRKLISEHLGDSYDNLCFHLEGALYRSKDIINSVVGKRAGIPNGVTLVDFLKTKLSAGKSKYVIVYNIDSMSIEAQHAFRRLMEKHNASCRFVFIGNEAEKVIEPLISRTLTLKLTLLSYMDSMSFLNRNPVAKKLALPIRKRIAQSSAGDFRKLNHHIALSQFLVDLAPEEQERRFSKIFNLPPLTTIKKLLEKVQQRIDVFDILKQDLVDHGYNFFDITNTLAEFVLVEESISPIFRNHVLEVISKLYADHNSTVHDIHIYDLFSRLYQN